MNTRIITLTNGVKIASFNNNTGLIFEDGQKLDAMTADEFKKLKVNYHTATSAKDSSKNSHDVRVVYFLSPYQLDAVEHYKKLYQNGEVDVVLAPIQFMTALIQAGWTTEDLKNSPFRTAYYENKTHKIIAISKFTIPF